MSCHRFFYKVITSANSGNNKSEHFPEVRKMVDI